MSELAGSSDDHGGDLLLNLLPFLLGKVLVILVKSCFPMSGNQKHEVYHFL